MIKNHLIRNFFCTENDKLLYKKVSFYIKKACGRDTRLKKDRGGETRLFGNMRWKRCKLET